MGEDRELSRQEPDWRALLMTRVERLLEVPLLVLALVMIPILVVPLLVELSPSVADSFEVASWFIWAVFALELGFRLTIARQRWRFFARNWGDVVVVLVPFLRPLRVVRSTRLLRLLRLTRLIGISGVVFNYGRRLLTSHHLHVSLLIVFVIVVVSGGLAFELEGSARGSIGSFGDGLWWAIATVTTVGYGDEVPTTNAGRGLGIFLMLTGVVLFAVITANLAAFFVDSSETHREASEADAKLDVLLAKIENLETQLLRSQEEGEAN